jgi:stress response protein YsnF
VIKENFEVGKRQEETGGIRIHKRVVDQPVEQKVNLREEHVKVDLKNVDRPATDADFDHSKDEDIEIREHSEVPVVNKEARVVEEIRVKKEVTERNETVKGSVRNTEVHVDELEPHHDEHR